MDRLCPKAIICRTPSDAPGINYTSEYDDGVQFMSQHRAVGFPKFNPYDPLHPPWYSDNKWSAENCAAQEICQTEGNVRFAGYIIGPEGWKFPFVNRDAEDLNEMTWIVDRPYNGDIGDFISIPGYSFIGPGGELIRWANNIFIGQVIEIGPNLITVSVLSSTLAGGRPQSGARLAYIAITMESDAAEDCVTRLLDDCIDEPPPVNKDPCLSDPASCQPVERAFNDAQSCTFYCPDRTAFVWTVAAGIIEAENKATANELAYARACERVAEHWACLGIISEFPCVEVPYAAIIVGSGPDAPFVFDVTSGSLPDGLTLQQVDGRTVSIIGTPTTVGNSSFTLHAVTAAGAHIYKNYVLGVMGITNASPLPDAQTGAFYSVQLTADGGSAPYTFEIEDGTLPSGLGMALDGTIQGTPDTVEFQDIHFRVTDSANPPRTCLKHLTIEVLSGCPAFVQTVDVGAVTFPGVGTAHTSNILTPRIYAIARLNDLAFFDRETNAFLNAVVNSSGDGPDDILYVPTTEEFWSNTGLLVLHVINANTRTSVTEIADGQLRSSMKHHSGNNHVICRHSNAGNYFLQRFNAVTHASLGETLAQAAGLISFVWMEYSPTQNLVYMLFDASAVPADSFIKVFDSTYTHVATITLTGHGIPVGLGYDVASDKLYVAFRVPNEIVSISCASGLMLNTIAVANQQSSYMASRGNGIFATKDGTTIFFWDTATDTLACTGALTTAAQMAFDDLGRFYTSKVASSLAYIFE